MTQRNTYGTLSMAVLLFNPVILRFFLFEFLTAEYMLNLLFTFGSVGGILLRDSLNSL